MRAETVIHAEYEILKEVLSNIPLDDIHDAMVTDEVSEKRFKTGARNVAVLINNLLTRRIHRLPKTHEEYKPKEE